MKLVLLLLGGLSLVLLPGCGEAPPPESGNAEADYSNYGKREQPEATTSTGDKAPAAARPAAKPEPKESEPAQQQEKGAVESVLDYGTGVTPLKIKKRKTKQLRDIQNKRNQQLEDALKDE